MIAGYIRVSTEMQIDKDSIRTQEDRIIEYAKSQHKEYRIYNDAGLSAKDSNRSQLQQLKEDIRKGIIQEVVVMKLDRITRSLRDLVELQEFFEKYDVKFISLTQNLDTSTPMGRFVFYILGNLAQLEREMISERVQENMKARAFRKLWNGGVNPFGYTSQARLYREYLEKMARETVDINDPKQIKKEVRKLEKTETNVLKAKEYAIQQISEKGLIIDQDEATIVKKIFKIFIETASIRRTVFKLCQLNIKTRHQQAWSTTSIRRILTNSIYIGELIYNKRKQKGSTSVPRSEDEHIKIPNAVEPIIEQEVFEKAQRIIQSNKTTITRDRKTKYLFTGLVKCAECGASMYGRTYRKKPDKKYLYYICGNHVKKGETVCCNSKMIVNSDLESIVLSQLEKIVIQPEYLKNKITVFNKKYNQENSNQIEEKEKLNKNLKKIETKITRLIELYEEAMIDKKEFNQRYKTLANEKEILQTELDKKDMNLKGSEITEEDVDQVVHQIKNFDDVYTALEFEDKRELLKTLINDIQVGGEYIDFGLFVPITKSALSDERMSMWASYQYNTFMFLYTSANTTISFTHLRAVNGSY